MVDDGSARAEQPNGMGEEAIRRHALPYRIRRREMLADVAETGGAEQRVRDCVKHDVGVAVPGKTAAVRHLDAAEHDRSFTGEGMDVEAHARSRRKPASEPLLGAVEVRRESQLFERGVAFDRRNLHAGGAKDGRFIGGRGARPALIRRFDRGQPKRLRGLDSRKPRAVDWRFERVANAGERVTDG
jgi:hypothetical protein